MIGLNVGVWRKYIRQSLLKAIGGKLIKEGSHKVGLRRFANIIFSLSDA